MVSSMLEHEIIDSLLISNSMEIYESQNSQVPVVNNSTNSTNITSRSNNCKMGSRRIFTPQFKLQVLESYRNDNDCKGNQRATARKYNIHRRQIQKWLQCESNLRSSVANINQNNVKHQFHNISHHHQEHLQMTASTRSYHYSHYHNDHEPHQHQQFQQQRPLQNIARQNVAFNVQKAISTVVEKSPTATEPDILAAANLAADAAADAGTIAKVNTPFNTYSSTGDTPLRQSTTISNSFGPTALHTTLQPHHNYFLMPYSHTPVSVSRSVPILSHQIPSQHHILYPNLLPDSKSLIQEQKPLEFLPTASLPVPVMSAASLMMTTTENAEEKIIVQHERNFKYEDERELIITETTETKFANENFNELLNKINSKSSKNKQHQIMQHPLSAPIDLSVRQRCNFNDNAVRIVPPKKYEPFLYAFKSSKQTENVDTVVDLTFRKRKIGTNVSNSQSENTLDKDNIHKIKVDEITDEVEIDVEENIPQLKPLKLFKPYLLDIDAISQKSSDNEQRNPIIWSHHPDCISPNSNDSRQYSSRSPNFQSPSYEKHTFPAESSYSHAIKTKRKLCSDIAQPAIEVSPEGFRCPKGSPVSGYESSSSTFSDSSSREDSTNSRAYSIALKLEPIYNDSLILNESNIQKWLDQKTNKNPVIPLSSSVFYH